MSKLTSLFYLLLSLAGCDHGRTVVTHIVDDGHIVDSRVQVVGDLASFHCLRSRSGICHYTVLPHSCATSGTGCKPALSSFSMHEGDSLLIARLPANFASCVTDDAAAATQCAAQLAQTSP